MTQLSRNQNEDNGIVLSKFHTHKPQRQVKLWLRVDIKQRLHVAMSGQTHRVDLWLKHSEGEVQVKDLQEIHDQTGHQTTCRETKLTQHEASRQ